MVNLPYTNTIFFNICLYAVDWTVFNQSVKVWNASYCAIREKCICFIKIELIH